MKSNLMYKGPNGQPELWISYTNCSPEETYHDRLRIIYPNGNVEYLTDTYWWLSSCNSDETMDKAKDNIFTYNITMLCHLHNVFLGYL